MLFHEIVNKRERELIEKNFEELREHYGDSVYQEKIVNYCDKFGCQKEVVEKKIIEDDYFAAFFIKDPSKQNFTEHLVEELLETKVLPQSGKRSIRFDENGDICSTKKANSTKSADFLIDDVYITQKYTRGNGGAQDNQFKDVVDFLEKGSKTHKVAALVDGSFWDNGHREELRKFFNENNNVKILSMDDILGGERFD